MPNRPGPQIPHNTIDPLLEKIFPLDETTQNLGDPIEEQTLTALFPHLPEHSIQSITTYLNEENPENRYYQFIVRRLLNHLAAHPSFEARTYLFRQLGQIIRMILDQKELSAFIARVEKRVRTTYLPTSEISRLLGRGDHDYDLSSMAAMMLQEAPSLSIR